MILFFAHIVRGGLLVFSQGSQATAIVYYIRLRPLCKGTFGRDKTCLGSAGSVTVAPSLYAYTYARILINPQRPYKSCISRMAERPLRYGPVGSTRRFDGLSNLCTVDVTNATIPRATVFGCFYIINVYTYTGVYVYVCKVAAEKNNS